MSPLAELAVLVMLAAAPAPAPAFEGTPAAAVEAIASGQDEHGAAAAHLVALGRPGLWALTDALKTRTGAEKGRVVEAIGRFRTPEAEWAVLVELKRAPPDVKPGAIRGVARLDEPKLTNLLVEAIASPDEAVREAGVDGIVILGAKARAEIPKLLASDDPKQRAAGARILARVNHRGLIEPALPGLLKDDAPEVLAAAVPLAARSKDPVHVSALARIARRPEGDLAVAAVDGLFELRGANAGYELATIAADPAVPEVVWRRAAEHLRRLGPTGIPSYVDALDRARGERQAALLDQLAATATDAEIDQLVPVLGDLSPARAALGRTILDRFGDRGAARAFARLHAAPAVLRRALVAYLGARKDAEIAQKLVLSAKQGSDHDRLAAIDLLGELDDRAALAGLVDLLGDPSEEIRAAVAVAIGRVASLDVREGLLLLTRDHASVARVGAFRGLARGHRGVKEVIAAGLLALTDRDVRVRLAAIALLSQPAEVRVVRSFRVRVLEATSPERAAIADALADSRMPEAIELLVDLTTDWDPSVRQAAMRALGATSS